MWKYILISVILLEFLPVVLLVLPEYTNNEFIEVAEEKRNYDEYPNLSTNEEEVTKGRRKKIDPHGSWINFLRRKHKNSERKRKNKNKRLRLTCPPGPMGPAGPPGPPGPPGARITKEVMLEEFKELVKKATDKRLSELAAEKCPKCSDTNNTGIPNLFEKDELLTVPRITVGFYLRLRRNVMVNGRMFMELETFSQPFAAGSFQRGDPLNVKNGRFIAPRNGIYHFSANIHIRLKIKGRRRAKLKRRDTVTTQICIDSYCKQNASLRHLTGLESNSKIFTISFSGLLQLQAGQYTSIYVDNASHLNIVVQSGSEFTGILIGS